METEKDEKAKMNRQRIKDLTPESAGSEEDKDKVIEIRQSEWNNVLGRLNALEEEARQIRTISAFCAKRGCNQRDARGACVRTPSPSLAERHVASCYEERKFDSQ